MLNIGHKKAYENAVTGVRIPPPPFCCVVSVYCPDGILCGFSVISGSREVLVPGVFQSNYRRDCQR